MDSPNSMTPPSRRSEAPRLLRSRPPPCLSQAFDEDSSDNANTTHGTTPPPAAKSPISPSPLHLALHASSHGPLQELLLLSRSPARRHKSLVLAQGENVDPAVNPRKKAKNRAAAVAANMGLMGCASPRNARRARRRLEKDGGNREERQLEIFDDDVAKVRKRRQSKPVNSRKEKPTLVIPPVLPPSPSPNHTSDRNDQSGLDGLRDMILELIMWKDVAKSSLWFGLGSLCFISSCFSRELSFCVVSAISHLGLLILALAFFFDSVSQRNHEKVRRVFKFKEEDILRATRVVLPTVNAAIATAQEIFSGEPSMTLKVAPVLLLTAKYGHLITLWRLLATGFFLSFTAPKLYSSYSSHIRRQADNMGRSVLEAWKASRHKRLLAVAGATILWNLFSVKTRVFAAFFCLVVLRYHHQRQGQGAAEGEGGSQRREEGTPHQGKETMNQRALTVPDNEEIPTN
uniref:Reticulon-like protein n=1 Tax=Anthurium amnicola TaxID=1678845 RepID=A0A1D1YCV3_9ARAE